MQSLPSHPLSDAAKHFIDKVILQENGRAGALLTILQRVQDSHARKFLPRETLEYISLKANVPLSRLFSVVTFYALFNLEPQGRLPHARLEPPARTSEDELGAARRGRRRDGQADDDDRRR